MPLIYHSDDKYSTFEENILNVVKSESNQRYEPQSKLWKLTTQQAARN